MSLDALLNISLNYYIGSQSSCAEQPLVSICRVQFSMSDSSTHYKEGWRFSILTKLAQRPHEYKFTWNQAIGNKSRAFVIKQSTIKEAGWGLFADQNFANNDDLVVGDQVDDMYNLEDVMSKFGNKIYFIRSNTLSHKTTIINQY